MKKAERIHAESFRSPAFLDFCRGGQDSPPCTCCSAAASLQPFTLTLTVSQAYAVALTITCLTRRCHAAASALPNTHFVLKCWGGPSAPGSSPRGNNLTRFSSSPAWIRTVTSTNAGVCMFYHTEMSSQHILKKPPTGRICHGTVRPEERTPVCHLLWKIHPLASSVHWSRRTAAGG